MPIREGIDEGQFYVCHAAFAPFVVCAPPSIRRKAQVAASPVWRMGKALMQDFGGI
jgi:hypothetical protein